MNKTLSIVTGVLGFFLGLILVRVPYLTLDSDVNIIDLANLVALIVLTIVIPVILNSRLDNKKNHKELLILEVTALCESLFEINESIIKMNGNTPTRDQFNSIINLFKRANGHMNQICEEVSSIGDKNSMEKCKKFQEGIKIYWDVVTGDEGIKIQNFMISAGFIWKQSKRYDDLVRAARSLRFEINRIV